MKFYKKRANANRISIHDAENRQPVHTESLKADLSENIKLMKEVLGYSGDIVIREIRIGPGGRIRAAMCYTEGLVDMKS
ncbi:MAG: spore germination protein, partial [Paenibacillus sp.]|nr:spore germination protein [Paenibacillus sp.]